MFNNEEIIRRINQGENSTTEFKDISKWRDEYGEAIAAFANDFNEVGGGVLLIGVSDDGDITGFTGNFNKLQKQVSDFCRDKCTPPIAPQIYQCEINGKLIIVIEVERSETRPIRLKNICWIRIGSTNRAASLREELKLAEKTLRITFDSTLVEEARITDLKLYKIKQYFIESRSREVAQADIRSPEELAEHFEFVKDINGELIPTVASILIFAENTQQFFPLSSINAIKFDGTSVVNNFINRKQIGGNLDEIVDRTTRFVEENTFISSEFKENDINRHDYYEYPEKAIREAILNAVLHRDYRDPGTQISLKIFDDRLEIQSPGGLEPPMTRKNFGSGAYKLRNPNLAQIIYDWKPLAIKFERAGTDIPKIRQYMKMNGSPEPKFEIDDNFVKVILPAHPFFSEKRRLEKSLLSDVAAWRSLAIRNKLEGNFSKASALFQKVTELEPDNARNWLERGQAEIKLRHWQKAKQLLEQALMRNPQKKVAGWIHQDLAYVLFRLRSAPGHQEKYIKISLEINLMTKAL